MPWRGPAVEGEAPTLGWEVLDWIEANCVVPDGDYQGLPFVLATWQREYVLDLYRLHPDADRRVAGDVRARPNRAFVYPRGGIDIEPQKKGKGPFSASIALAEAYGPVLFDGWDASGEPVGRPWATPLIAVTAQSEDQSKNVWDALYWMVLLSGLKADIENVTEGRAVGMTRINLPNGGKIEPVTAAAKSRQGARITHAVQDEVQSWDKRGGGIRLADTQYRSLSGMGGRFTQWGNAWDPNEETVAKQTWDSGQGILRRMAVAPPGSVRNMRDRMRILNSVYADSPWMDLERISVDIDDFIKRGDVAQAERFFFNRIVPGEDRAFDIARWDELAVPPQEIGQAEWVVIGVDGARYRDAIAIIATHIQSGYQWPLGIWERPPNAADDYEHPMDEVDGAMADAFERFNVWRAYVDPGSQYANISALMEKWQGRWGEKKVVAWMMNRPKPSCDLIRNFTSAIMTGDITHHPSETFRSHIANARRRMMTVTDDDGRQMHTIQKESPGSSLKIDAAAAAALSWEARGDAIAAGVMHSGGYDDPANKCGRPGCGHIRRHHSSGSCRARPPGHCTGWVEPVLE